MVKRIQRWSDVHPVARWVYPILIILISILFFASSWTGKGYGWLYLGLFALLMYAFRPNSALHKSTAETDTPAKILCTVLTAAVTAAACVSPMEKLPLWNGEEPGHRNQYELMAEAILDGRIEFAYGDEDSLSGLTNPYDPAEREEAGVWFHWDHAYYKGHYYMYFGIVPVFLAFLPYRLITGEALTTYRATQLFAALAIAGIFALFHMLARRFFKKLPFSVYLALAAAFSAMSVWYSAAEPALYCTAITGAAALEIWSLFFFIRAVWVERRENRQLLLAGIGAALGALTVGCRPSIALANILVIPMLAVFLKQRRFTLKLLGKLALAALPYVLVAAGLMWYNYARFENPFEFGQAYQLTVADQSQYRVTLDAEMLLRIFNGTVENFFWVNALSAKFPFLQPGSVLFNFPILLLGLVMFDPASLRELRGARLLPVTVCLIMAALLITAVDVMWTPFLLERYRMDIYFLLGICCFIGVGARLNACTGRGRARLGSAAAVLSVVTLLSAFLLYAYRVNIYYPEKIGELANALHLA